MKKPIIQEAKLKDCKKVQVLINTNDPKKFVLPRSYAQLVVMLPNYFVAICDGEIIGCCGFRIYPDGSVEIISLVVAERFRCNGLGPELVNRCVEKAKKFGLKIFLFLQWILVFLKN